MSEANYEDKTDLQLDYLVSAEKWKDRCMSKQQWNNTAQRTYKEIQDGKCVYADARHCSNPSDAWPIMNVSRIEIKRDSCQAHISSYFNPTFVVSCRNDEKEVLRAAMICFLEMSGVSND